MILECDIGNTHVKWRVVDDENNVVSRLNGSKWENATIELPALPVKKIRALSVAGEEAKGQLVEAVRKTYGAPLLWAKTERHAGGVTCAYDNPAKLGVDRWAAAVAAYNKYQTAVLVVDAGSAITVDAVDAKGQHLGGYIAPGNALMKYALETRTNGVRFADAFDEVNVEFGSSTDSAVQSGVFAAQLGLVEVALQQARQVLGSYQLCITGGSANSIRKKLSVAGWYEPDLVLDGLVWLIP